MLVLSVVDSDNETLLYSGYENASGPKNKGVSGGLSNTVPDYSHAGYKGKNYIFQVTSSSNAHMFPVHVRRIQHKQEEVSCRMLSFLPTSRISSFCFT